MNDLPFNNWTSMSDQALAAQIGKFARHHRMEQNRTQGELAIPEAKDITQKFSSLPV